MSSIAISSIVFACVFGGALAGICLRGLVPKHHLAPESRGVVTAGMGLVATLAALVLGLLIASAKGSYDSQSTEVTELSAKVVFLDRVLAHYGPDAREARELLRSSVARAIDQMWSNDPAILFKATPGTAGAEVPADTGTLTQERLAAGNTVPRYKHRDGSWTNALAAIRTETQLRIDAGACCADLLGHGPFC